MEFVPITELEAIQELLLGIGEVPIESIDEVSNYPEAELAQKKIHRISRMVQSKGLDCNTEEEYELEPDGVTKEITIPTDALFCEPSYTYKYTVRGGKLYDKSNHTYQFNNKVKVTLVSFLDFEDLPQHVRQYITALAKKDFQVEMLGSDSVNAQRLDELRIATAEFNRSEINSDPRTMLDNPQTYNIVRRYW